VPEGMCINLNIKYEQYGAPEVSVGRNFSKDTGVRMTECSETKVDLIAGIYS
jgi:hypothetical protein